MQGLMQRALAALIVILAGCELFTEPVPSMANHLGNFVLRTADDELPLVWLASSGTEAMIESGTLTVRPDSTFLMVTRIGRRPCCPGNGFWTWTPDTLEGRWGARKGEIVFVDDWSGAQIAVDRGTPDRLSLDGPRPSSFGVNTALYVYTRPNP